MFLIHPNSLRVIYYRPLLQQIVLPAQLQRVVKDDELLEFEVENHHASFCNVLWVWCRNLLVALVAEVKACLPENVSTMLMMQTLMPLNALADAKPWITALAPRFKNVTIDDVQREWQALCYSEKLKPDLSPVEFWANTMNETNVLGEPKYSYVSRLALALLSLHFSNAVVERAFSELAIVKTKHRNKLHVPTKAAIMTIHFDLLRRN